MRAYPDAKVILTTRDPVKWYTVWLFEIAGYSNFIKNQSKFIFIFQ